MSATTPLVVLVVGALLSAQTARLSRERSDRDRAAAAVRAKQDRLNIELGAIVEKRAAVWDKMGPETAKAFDLAWSLKIQTIQRKPWPTAIANELNDRVEALNGLYETYQPYFSDDFNDALGNSIRDTILVWNVAQAGMTRQPSDKARAMLNQRLSALLQDKSKLRSSLARELHIPPLH